MHRMIYMDLNLLESVATMAAPNPDPDPRLVLEVDRAFTKLQPRLRDTLKPRYYNGETIREIASGLGISENEVRRLIYEAKRRLRLHLAEFVRDRWGIENGNTCRICIHPQRERIETILRAKKPEDSWKSITDKVCKLTGERFQPPQILKAHFAHITSSKVGQDE